MAEESKAIAVVAHGSIELFVRACMSQEEERLVADVQGAGGALRRNQPLQIGVSHAPMLPEEVIPFHLLVPRRLVFLAPDALPPSGKIGREDVFLQLFRITVYLVNPESPSIVIAVNVMVAHDEEFLHLAPVRRAAVGEHLAPGVGMGLHLPDLTAIGHVPAMDDRIHVEGAEMAEGRDEKLVRPMFHVDPPARAACAQMRVAHNAKGDVGVLRRNPALRRGEDASTCKCSGACDRRRALQGLNEKIASIQKLHGLFL